MPARGGSRSPMIADKAHPSGARARATRRLLLALLVGVSAAAVLNWASMTFLWSGAESSRPRSKAAAARRPAGLSRKQEACVVAAVDSSAGVHSRIDKGGPLDIRLWHANHSDWRGDRFRKWAARGVVNPHTFPHSRVGLEGHVLVSGPPAFPYCRVFVNHQYKILYLRAPKVASTTILGFFGSCGRPDQGGNKTSCLSPLEEVGSAAAYSEMWRSYFVFGFTRNPWARAVSSFRMLERYLAPRAPGCHAAATWRAFCADPSSVGRLHHEMPQCSRPGRGEGFALHHIIAQEPCLAAATGGGLAADWLGRLEHLEADLGELVGLLEARRAEATPEAPPLDTAAAAALQNVNGVACVDVRGRTHARASPGQGCDIRGYFAGDNGACFRQIAHFYKGDVVSLKFPDCISGLVN